jgi:hypothetical protein
VTGPATAVTGAASRAGAASVPAATGTGTAADVDVTLCSRAGR